MTPRPSHTYRASRRNQMKKDRLPWKGYEITNVQPKVRKKLVEKVAQPPAKATPPSSQAPASNTEKRNEGLRIGLRLPNS